jgi:hypothetical protein
VPRSNTQREDLVSDGFYLGHSALERLSGAFKKEADSGAGAGAGEADATGEGATGGAADASGADGAAGASEGSGDHATPDTGAEAEGLTQEQRNALRDEATNSRVGSQTGAAGNRLKEADSLEDDLAEGQQKTARQLREHATNTSLVDDFG